MKSARWSTFVLAVQLLGTILATPASAQEEASRVRILLVLDTFDRMGATWGLDGENMKAVFEHAFQKQDLLPGQHYTIDMYTGNQVTVENVLNYYRKLKVSPNETLVFYYSGHGGYHAKNGHFMALTLGHQQLYRNDVLKAMEAKKPRLTVVLTDCCANLAGGAWHKEPADVVIQSRPETGDPPAPRAARVEPAGAIRLNQVKPQPFREPPRPAISVRKIPKAKIQEPPAEVRTLSTSIPSTIGRATRVEPDAILSKYVVLRSAGGGVPRFEVLSKTDGKILRQLLFQHRGLVDINGCPKGDISQGTLEWGGSLFTLAFIHLQTEDFAKLDANGDGFLEWREIVPPWVQMTQRINRAVSRGGPMQTPEVWQMKVAK